MTITAQETQDTPSTDRIEKTVVVRATRSRVWRAISTAEEFGTWFRVNLEGAFAEGEAIRGRIAIPGYEHVTMEMLVERIDPERYFSYRWHPYAVDPAVDYTAEPTTLVEFTLDDAEDGIAIKIVESGFDQLPAARQAEAFRMNQGGWNGQAKHLSAYVS